MPEYLTLLSHFNKRLFSTVPKTDVWAYVWGSLNRGNICSWYEYLKDLLFDTYIAFLSAFMLHFLFSVPNQRPYLDSSGLKVLDSLCERARVNAEYVGVSVCVFVSLLSHRGDGLHMQSVFTALKEIMTIAENPPAISLRSHLSVSLCACILCEGTRCVCVCVCACGRVSVIYVSLCVFLVWFLFLHWHA